MLIQPITNQKYKTSLLATKQTPYFRGQLGNKVIQNIEKNGVKNIDEVLKILGITGASAAVVANLKDFVESISEKFDSHKNELQESEQAVANVLKVFEDIWPMMLIFSVILISLRIVYLYKNKEKFIVTPSDKADKVLTHKIWGLPIFLVVLFNSRLKIIIYPFIVLLSDSWYN